MVAAASMPASEGTSAKATPLGVLPGGPVTPSGTCMGAAPDAGFFCAYAENYLEHAGFTADRLATGGYTIRTTMDPRVSQAAKDAVDANVPTTQDGVANTFTVVQPGQDGHQVLAMVANRDFGEDPAKGQKSTDIVADPANVFGAGSSFKIFTSAAALVTGAAGLDTPLPNPDSECFPPPGGRGACYPVHNDGHYADPITLANGLATSPNVAFVGLEAQVGLPAVLDMARKLGLRNTLAANDAGGPPDPQSKDPQYGEPQSQYFQNLLSFTLGDSPVSPLEMANVSATLMSGGKWCPPNPILAVTDRAGNAVPLLTRFEVQVDGFVSTGGLGGPAILPLSLAKMSQLTQAFPDKSFSGIGGISTFAHALNYFLLGCGTVQVCTAAMLDHAIGPNVIRELNTGLARFLESHADKGWTGVGEINWRNGNGESGTVAAPPYFRAMSELLAGIPDTPIPPPDPDYLTARG